MVRIFYSVRFNPFPYASHSPYLDQVLDYKSGKINREYVNYDGAIDRSEVVFENDQLLRAYLCSFVDNVVDCNNAISSLTVIFAFKPELP